MKGKETILCCSTGERDYSNLSHVPMSSTSPSLEKLSAMFSEVQDLETARWRHTATAFPITIFVMAAITNPISSNWFQVDHTNEEVA